MSATFTLPSESTYNPEVDQPDDQSGLLGLRGRGYVTGRVSWVCDDCGKLNKQSHYQSDCGYINCQKCGSPWVFVYQLQRAPLCVPHRIVLERLRLRCRELARQPAE